MQSTMPRRTGNRIRGSRNVDLNRCSAVFDAFLMGVKVVQIELYFKMPKSTVWNVLKRERRRREGGVRK